MQSCTHGVFLVLVLQALINSKKKAIEFTPSIDKDNFFEKKVGISAVQMYQN